MKEKLFDSEAKIMEILWERGSISAKEISLIAAERIGWNKNTTYTVIKKLEAKGLVRRNDPGFICTPLVSQSEIRKSEAVSLMNHLAPDDHFTNFIIDFRNRHFITFERTSVKKDVYKRQWKWLGKGC